MKKRMLIIQSVIMIAITVLMLSVVSFAWFYSGTKSPLGGFNVSVVGSASVEYEFFRKMTSDGEYKKIDPTTDKLVLINGENLVPGVPIYARVDITNLSQSNIKVGLDIHRITYLPLEGLSPEEKADLSINFVAQRKAVLFADSANGIVGDEPSDETMSLKENEVRFLEGILSGATNSFELIRNETVDKSPNNKISIYYRFMLLPDFDGFNGLIFSLNAQEIRIIAELA